MSTTRDAILRAAVDRTGEETVLDTKKFEGSSDAAKDRALATGLLARPSGPALRGAPERPPTPEEELARLIQDALANSTDTQQA
jgi:hypothetical protein